MSAKKILLVDDAATMLLMEQMALGTGGYELITARDGEAAVRAALAHLPDLLVLDADMPKMDGLEVGRSLRAHELTREIPILLVSARGEEDRAAHPLPGRGGYVTRPIQGPELLAKVKSLLDDAP